MSFLAYKGFNEDLTCRNFQYEIGKTYAMVGSPEICKRGFHFCRKLIDVLGYYPTTILLDDYPRVTYDDYLNLYPRSLITNNRYCVVEVIGEVDWDNHYDTKGATNQIKIVRELTKEEIIYILSTEDETFAAAVKE